MTISYPIYNRFTGAVQFTAEIDCSEDTSLSVRVGLSVRWAIANKQNLRHANLRDADLCDADLRDSDLRDANLCHANLRGANLRGANLRGANLGGADLCGADLRGANLCYADLRYADLGGANLGGADLRHANLRGADLRDADLCDADLRDSDLGGSVGYLPLPVSDPRGYHHHAIWCDTEWRIRAGCRNLTIAEARQHWLSDKYIGPKMVHETMEFALDWLERQETPKTDDGK